MSEHPFLQVNHFKEALRFLNFLSPSHPRWGTGDSPSWIFRGHASDEWDLLPSSRRRDRFSVLEPLLKRFADEDPDFGWQKFVVARDNPGVLKDDEPARRAFTRTYVKAEMFAVSDFAKLGDELGLRLPSDYLKLDGYPEYDRFVPTDTAILAQHHGIPTPLIDWTRRPRVAAFFAAQQLPNADPDSRLAVWALDASRVVWPGKDGDPGSVIRTLSCPKSDHRYLHAQDGLLTFVDDMRHYNFMMNHGRWMTIVDAVATHYHHLDYTKGPVLRKCTLPRSRVAELRQLLLRERISLGHLIPTFDNVTVSVMDRWQWLK